MRKLLVIFAFLTLFQLFPSHIFAHGAGLPYVEVNGETISENQMYDELNVTKFKLGKNFASPSGYLIRTDISFEVEEEALPNALKGSQFLWDFGDGTEKKEGVSVTHTYQKTGTYIVELLSKGKDKVPSLTSIQISVVPSSSYVFPQAIMSFEGETIENADRDTKDVAPYRKYAFDGSKSQGKVKKYIWDFGDGVGSEKKAPKHVYRDKNFITVYPVLRVIDENGIVNDTYATLDFPIGNENKITSMRDFFMKIYSSLFLKDEV